MVGTENCPECGVVVFTDEEYCWMCDFNLGGEVVEIKEVRIGD